MTTPLPHDERKYGLIAQVRRWMRLRRMSPRTEEAYVMWIRRYVVSNGTRHPSLLNERHITEFLTKLAIDSRVAA